MEASFTDMRHGGDGDVRRAYEFAKKVRGRALTTRVDSEASPCIVCCTTGYES